MKDMEGVLRNKKELGAFYTPTEIASFLVKWAIRNPNDLVLDPGAGDGIFLRESFKRLEEVGQQPDKAVCQLYGIELDKDSFYELVNKLKQTIGYQLPHIYNADFFDMQPGGESIPKVDAVVGNPPYVRRMLINRIEAIRRKAFQGIEEKMKRDADIYCYFLLHSSKFLKPHGRLAMILSDSWLTTDYGIELKDFLLKHFKVKALVNFDERVFQRILVKSVLLLAEKNGHDDDGNHGVKFLRVKKKIPEDLLSRYIGSDIPEYTNEYVTMSLKPYSELKGNTFWGIYTRAPPVYFELIKHHLITKLRKVAVSRIGLITLADNFFILPKEKAHNLGIETEYLRPILVSPKDLAEPVVENPSVANCYVIYFDKLKQQLAGTNLLRYIEWGESVQVRERNKEHVIVGYHNIPRIQRANRKPWYNIKTEIDKRGRMPILLPRRTYKRFIVFLNKALLIANGNFIEVKPEDDHIIPLLAMLNSSVFELIVRIHSHIYGGGVFNLNPNDVKELYVLDMNALSQADKDLLTCAYEKFVKSKGLDRDALDYSVFSVLGLSEDQQRQVLEQLSELSSISLKLRSG